MDEIDSSNFFRFILKVAVSPSSEDTEDTEFAEFAELVGRSLGVLLLLLHFFNR